MTRDEAIAIFKEHKIGKEWEADWIDKLAALGVLKLDEPKSGWGLFIQAMADEGYTNPHSIALRDVSSALDRAGLMIVQK